MTAAKQRSAQRNDELGTVFAAIKVDCDRALRVLAAGRDGKIIDGSVKALSNDWRGKVWYLISTDAYGGRVDVDISNYLNGHNLVPLFRQVYGPTGLGYAIHESYGVKCRRHYPVECRCAKERDPERTIVYICVPGGEADQLWSKQSLRKN